MGPAIETDGGAVEDALAIYPLAFPDEELRPLVRALVATGETLSLVIRDEGSADDGGTGDSVGHALFTRVRASDGGRGALLGPLAVRPDRARRGIGTRLVRDGLARLKAEGVRQVFVLGDPLLYGRFGFGRGDRVLPPYALPPEWAGAWQSLMLGGVPLPPGPITLPAPWMERSLWVPPGQ